MRTLLVLLCLTVAWRAEARVGLVHTLDGRTLHGDVAFTNGIFTVNGTNEVALTNLLLFNIGGAMHPAPSGRGSGNGLLGFYFANTNLSGDAFVRLDETIQFEWGMEEPTPETPRDHFSVVWTGEVEPPAAGKYHFDIFTRGVGRLYLDGKLVAEDREPRPAGKSLHALTLREGQRVPLRFEYVESGGAATAKLMWMGPNMALSVIPKDRLHARSGVTNHTATLGTSMQGLLATYYAKSDFTGPAWTRIDPGIDFDWSAIDPLPNVARTNFSVRWSGQILADHNESYTFHLLADEPLRLWINGKLVLATGGDQFFFERRESLPLFAGERNDIRLETQSTGGNATAKLAWSSPSTPKAPVPATHLFPSRPTPTRDTFVDLTDKTPPGVLLRNNTFLAGSIERASESALRLSGRDTPLSTVNIARILLQPLPRRLEDRIVSGRAGLLLAKGDFVDTEFKGIDNGQVKASSILFGPRTYDAAKEVIAVVLRNSAPSASAFEIRLVDHSVIYAASVSAEGDTLVARDAMAGTLKLAFADVAQIKRAR